MVWFLYANNTDAFFIEEVAEKSIALYTQKQEEEEAEMAYN